MERKKLQNSEVNKIANLVSSSIRYKPEKMGSDPPKKNKHKNVLNKPHMLYK